MKKNRPFFIVALFFCSNMFALELHQLRHFLERHPLDAASIIGWSEHGPKYISVKWGGPDQDGYDVYFDDHLLFSFDFSNNFDDNHLVDLMNALNNNRTNIESILGWYDVAYFPGSFENISPDLLKDLDRLRILHTMFYTPGRLYGWSRDGKIAFFENIPAETGSMEGLEINLVVYDLVEDREISKTFLTSQQEYRILREKRNRISVEADLFTAPFEERIQEVLNQIHASAVEYLPTEKYSYAIEEGGFLYPYDLIVAGFSVDTANHYALKMYQEDGTYKTVSQGDAVQLFHPPYNANGIKHYYLSPFEKRMAIVCGQAGTTAGDRVFGCHMEYGFDGP